jgi:hypothetical protein
LTKKLDKRVTVCYNTNNKCEDGRRVAPQRLPQRGVGWCETQKTGRVNTLPEQRAEADLSVGRMRRRTAVIPSERFWRSQRPTAVRRR